MVVRGVARETGESHYAVWSSPVSGCALFSHATRYCKRITSATLPSSRMHAWGRQWMNEADATACERPQDQNRQSLQQYLLHVSPPGAYQLPLTNDCCAGSPERSRGD